MRVIPYDPTIHQAFVCDSWLRSYRQSGFAINSSQAEYFGVQQPLIHALLSAGQAAVGVDDADADVFIGFVVRHGPAVHYVYVKHAFRRFGLATQLLSDGGPVTHSSAAPWQWRYAWFRKHHVRYNPYAALDPALRDVLAQYRPPATS